MKKSEGIISILAPVFCRPIQVFAEGNASAVTAFDRNEKLIYILAAVFMAVIIISICVDRAVKVKRKKKRRQYARQMEDPGKNDILDLDAWEPERAGIYDADWAGGEGKDDYDIKDAYDTDWAWEKGKNDYDMDWGRDEGTYGYDIKRSRREGRDEGTGADDADLGREKDKDAQDADLSRERDKDGHDMDLGREEDEDGYDIDWSWARAEGKDDYDIDWRWEEGRDGYDIELRRDESSGHYDVDWGGDIEFIDLVAEPGPVSFRKAMKARDPVISVQDVTMIFQISTSNASSVKEYLIQQIKGQVTVYDLTALDHISFDVFKGEVVGIIGTNGSGKSTLLRIVSGALAPSGGRVVVDRKKVQLLTLGTGFDMELSARENVYLNGSIIGYSKEFLDTHYEEIVAFAELGDFMEEKVKNFSSGMVSRLGFAIATAGDAAEILILDEVLSVGDEFFRKKSLARIKEMIHGGSTVLMVSHSMGTILENCTKVVWIEKGKMMMVGEAKEVCGAYERMEKDNIIN